MFKLLKTIFSGPEEAGKIIDGVLAAGDKAWYTKEEKAEDAGKARDWYLKYLETTQPQNLSRRLIAVMVSALWVFVVLIGIMGYWIDEDFAKFVFSVLSESVNMPFSIIIGFYFGGHALQKLISGAKK